MEQIYQKVDNIDELAKEASLPYLGWKVLFLVDKNTDAKEISSLIGEDKPSVSEILQSLESKGLIEKVEKVEEVTAAEDKAKEPEAPSLGDELLVEDDSLLDETEEKPAEEAETKPQEETIPKLEETASLESAAAESEEKPDESATEESSGTAETDFVVDEGPVETTDEFDLGMDDEFSLGDQSKAESAVETAGSEPSVEEPPAEKSVDTDSDDEEIISDVSKKTLLVIDDSIVIRKMIEIALEDEDFNIVTAMSGKEGLESLEKENPNLIILDMMLPDMNGIDVLKTIKEKKKLPVIMLSGKDSPQLIENAKEIGVDDFLPKPFRDEELVEKVKTLVGA